MLRKKICLTILLLSTLTMSIPVSAQETTTEVEQVLIPSENEQELQPEEATEVSEPMEDPEAIIPSSEQEGQQFDNQLQKQGPRMSLVQYSNVCGCLAVLSISGSGEVTGVGNIAGYPSTTQITGYLYLERKVGDSWVDDWSWSKITTTTSLYMSESCNTSIHGTYRLRLSGYVYVGSSYEHIVKYSGEVIY